VFNDHAVLDAEHGELKPDLGLALETDAALLIKDDHNVGFAHDPGSIGPTRASNSDGLS
jgi:hypothetical protein